MPPPMAKHVRERQAKNPTGPAAKEVSAPKKATPAMQHSIVGRLPHLSAAGPPTRPPIMMQPIIRDAAAPSTSGGMPQPLPMAPVSEETINSSPPSTKMIAPVSMDWSTWNGPTPISPRAAFSHFDDIAPHGRRLLQRQRQKRLVSEE